MTNLRTDGPVKKAGIITSKVSIFGWAVWCAVSGVLSIITASVLSPALGAADNRYVLPIYVAGLTLQVAIAYIVIVGAARSSFTRTSFLSSARWVFGREPMTRLTSSIIIGIGLLSMIVLSGFSMDATTLNVYSLIVMTLTISRGLQHVYIAQYVESVSANIKPKSDANIKSKIVRFITPKRWKLITPLIQSVMVTVVPSQLILALLVTVLNWDYGVVTIIIATALPLWAALWAEWHRAGGFIRLTRIGRGRPMSEQS